MSIKYNPYTQKWKTHEFKYFNKKEKWNSNCIYCGVSWSDISKIYWSTGSSKAILTCDEFIIKKIIE